MLELVEAMTCILRLFSFKKPNLSCHNSNYQPVTSLGFSLKTRGRAAAKGTSVDSQWYRDMFCFLRDDHGRSSWQTEAFVLKLSVAFPSQFWFLPVEGKGMCGLPFCHFLFMSRRAALRILKNTSKWVKGSFRASRCVQEVILGENQETLWLLW